MYLWWNSPALGGKRSQLGLREGHHEPIVHRQYNYQPATISGKVWQNPEQSGPTPLGRGEKTWRRWRELNRVVVGSVDVTWSEG